MCLLRFAKIIFLIFIIITVVSCSNHRQQTKTRNICLTGNRCKSISNGVFSGKTFNYVNNSGSFFQNDDLNFTAMETDLQDIAMYNIHCKKCGNKRGKKNNQQIVNMYLREEMERKNGLPLNNVELNAVLKNYNGSQVNGFCNHTVSIVNPVVKFFEKQRFVIKDSIKRHGKIVM